MNDQLSEGTRAKSLDSQPQALDRIHNGKEFNSALLKVEMRFSDIVEAAVTDPKDRKEMKHDFSLLLDRVGEAYDEAAGYEPEVDDSDEGLPTQEEMENTA